MVSTIGVAVLLSGCGSSGRSSARSTPSSAATSTSSAPSATPADILAVPVEVASTSAGRVGYREVGRGSPLLLVTGFSASMDDWAPAFVDALASEHRVIVFDNSGVGQTAPTSSALTIKAMANQTSALITALGLGRTAVLGWSMGGMIAQELAVTHPSQVSRLILAATQAGTGTALPVPSAAAADAASTNPAKVLGVLFPADQVIAEQAYVKGILSYPGYYAAPPSVKTAQSRAIQQWLDGADPGGALVEHLQIPTLVADGTEDTLDPVANDTLLHRIIPDAQLVLYQGAGHGFLFQDAPLFVARVDQFLG
jgi:pimeloyl-ACP methyl ester carboxylesterase